VDSDPPNTHRSADGRFAYLLEGDRRAITNAQAAEQARRQPVMIENSKSGRPSQGIFGQVFPREGGGFSWSVA
jgi:hypothetical protein